MRLIKVGWCKGPERRAGSQKRCENSGGDAQLGWGIKSFVKMPKWEQKWTEVQLIKKFLVSVVGRWKGGE